MVSQLYYLSHFFIYVYFFSPWPCFEDFCIMLLLVVLLISMSHHLMSVLEPLGSCVACFTQQIIKQLHRRLWLGEKLVFSLQKEVMLKLGFVTLKKPAKASKILKESSWKYLLLSGVPPKPAPQNTWTCTAWLLLQDESMRERWVEEPVRISYRIHHLLGHLAVLLVRCTYNVSCYNVVELNFLLKEHDFPFLRS